MKIQFNLTSYAKVLLHASKYPHKAVNGVLLAKFEKGSDALQIVDVIPLFHQCLGLAPMLEVALSQIDSYCKQNNLVIAGYYQGNEHLEDNSPDVIAYKIAEKINDYFSHSLLVMINNEKMDAECRDPALIVYTFTDGKWKIKDTWQLVGGETSLSVTSQLIKRKTYQGLIDFDNHLDDITLDWLNGAINDAVSVEPS